MQAFLEYVVKQLVDYPNEVQVSHVVREEGSLFELRMRRSDVGKVVGRQGQTISAIRNLVNSALSAGGGHVDVEIVEGESDPE
ncbi:MAG: hypothetical protein RLZZ399_1597 [Verrucomicrobiota bacterium]|jgi:predicted RNA-binding protein YlqC (UPF0109 family)